MVFLLSSAVALPLLAAQEAVVIVPVADVWSEPAADPSKLPDEKRETQVLFGEKVLIHESSGTWTRIEAVEQPEFTHHNKWEGYPGWVMKNALGPPKVVKKVVMSSPQAILAFAQSAVRTPYLWGGLSNRGFDCSGLVHRAYREHEMKIPRDSYEQWMKAKPIKRHQLKPADLIFSAKKDNPKKITHVAIFEGYAPPHPPLSREGESVVDGWLIEAPQTGMAVRKISFKEKYGKDLSTVESGDTVGDRVIYFGSYLTQ
jgi:hypothetical protein